MGEIDFIALNSNKIVFVEVKTRSQQTSKFGTALESVNESKQRKLLLAVKMYFLKNPKFLNLQPQIDVMVVEYNEFDKSFKTGIIIPSAIEDFN